MTSDGATGLPLLAGHAATLVASFLLLLLWNALGAQVRWVVSRNEAIERAGTRWVIETGLGMGALGTLYLALGSLGLLRPWMVTGTAVLMAAACFAGGRRLATVSPRVGLPTRPVAMEEALLFFLMAGTCLLTTLGALAPSADWDSLMYHLRVPTQLLEAGRLIVPPDNLHVALVGIAHFATLPLLALGLDSGPAVMQALLLAGTVIATAELARAAGLGRQPAWLAGTILLGAPVFFLVALTARVDVALTFILVGAHLAMLQARNGSSGRGAVFCGAILLGVAVAIKPQAGAYALALSPLGWMAAGSPRRAFAAGALAMAIAVPWYLRNLIMVGAPLYPLGGLTRLQPWLATLLGSSTVPAGMDTRILDVLPSSRLPFNLWDAFVAPQRLTIEGEGRDYFLPPLLALAPLGALAWRGSRGVIGVMGVALAYALIVVVPFGEINLRYLMPAIPGLAVAAAAGAFILLDRLRHTPVRAAALVLLALAGSIHLGTALSARFGGEAVLLRHALGLASAATVRHTHPDPSSRGIAPVADAVDQIVPEGGRVVMFWEARGHAFQREVLVDVMLTNWSWLAQSPLAAACLEGTEITHVLVNVPSVRYYVGRGADPEWFQFPQLEAFADRCLANPRQVGGHVLFEVRPLAAQD